MLVLVPAIVAFLTGRFGLVVAAGVVFTAGGPFVCGQAAARRMRGAGGRIIHISSTAAVKDGR